VHLPFSSTDVVLELGGGGNALFHPNLDIRKMSGVDIVADLNERLPFEDNSFDGVYSSYLIEHVSWRKIRHLIQEIHRILKPGGRTFLITANLLEQARRLTETPVWTDSDVCMIFGDQNYVGDDWRANSHTCGFSPEFALKLFSEAGFKDIATFPHPNCKTDLIIEARKPMVKVETYKPRPSDVLAPDGHTLGMRSGTAADLWTPEQRKEAYDHHYFDGGGKVGGYANIGYMDFPAHWCTFNHIMDLKPTSVLELGCARGYILKRIEDCGIRVMGLEVSDHCYQTRVIKDVVTWDIIQTPWPIKDKEFDLCVSVATLEHIPEDKLPAIIREIERTTVRGLHGIDLGEHDDGFDKTHCTLRSLEWWQQRMPPSQQCVDKEAMEIGVGPPGSDDRVKLNIGSFTTMFHYGWINMDIAPLSDFANRNGFVFSQVDAKTPSWGIEDSTVDMIFTSHFLEHLSYTEGDAFLKHCHRLMKPGAIIRVLVPNMAKLANAYFDGDLLRKYGQLGNYENMTDAETLIKAMQTAGFVDVRHAGFRDSRSTKMTAETIDMFPDLSLIVEAIKT
jgi:predicted SAM-dependent methyltransferase